MQGTEFTSSQWHPQSLSPDSCYSRWRKRPSSAAWSTSADGQMSISNRDASELRLEEVESSFVLEIPKYQACSSPQGRRVQLPQSHPHSPAPHQGWMGSPAEAAAAAVGQQLLCVKLISCHLGPVLIKDRAWSCPTALTNYVG